MIIRRVARPLLSSIFISGGIDAIRNPSAKVAKAEPVIDLVTAAAAPVAQKVAVAANGPLDSAADAVDSGISVSPFDADQPVVDSVSSAAHSATDAVHQVAAGQPLPFENETYIRINGAVQVGAGVLLAFGRVPRLASTVLAASLVPTTLAGHRFWEHEGDERKAQQLQFAKNLSLVGGLILAAVDTEGSPDLIWRARHARRDAKVVAGAAKANAAIAAHAAVADAKAAKRLAKANAKVAGKGGKLGIEVAADHAGSGWRSARRRGRVVGDQAVARAHDASDLASAARTSMASIASDLAPVVQAAVDYAHARADELSPKVQAAADRVGEAAADLTPKVQAAAERASDRAADLTAELSPKIQAAAERAGERASDRAADLTPKAQALGHRVADALPIGS